MPGSTARLLRAIADEEQTDAELLGRFADRRDEAAFALLVRRHRAMVYGVCRRILPTDQDAEDAFQATFLVLVQKARTAPRDAVGSWLYGVARRAALLARRTIVTRRERGIGDYPAPEPMDDLRLALDEELSRLPDIYRTVIVLCDLEERTRREAAAMLGWPEGTVAGRLVRAREMLAKRLARHAPAVSVAAVLAGTASARVPEILAPTQAVPSAVAALTREVLGVMARGKLMKTAVAVLLLGCAGFGMALHAGQKPTTKEAPVPAPTADPPKAGDVAWGQEVDGLQLGLTGTAPTYRHGEKAKLEVKLRNVGTAEAKITHGMLREYAPQVTAGVRMTVAMPLPLGIKVRLEERVIKPGETVTLYNPEIVIESADMLRLVGELRVDTPTAYLAPGKYRIGYGGMVQSHPKLATGAAEFEVTEAKPVTAWGKEAGGLRAGLEVKEKQPYRLGETITLVVRVRNVGKETVKFAYIRQYLDEIPPAVTGADDKPIPQDKLGVTGVIHTPVEVGLEPGKEVVLETRIYGASGRPFDLCPVGGGGRAATKNHPLRVGTGKVSLQYEKVFGNSSIGQLKIEPGLAQLATGKLELEVTDPAVRLPEPEPDVQEVSDLPPVVRGPLQKDGARAIKARKDVVGKPVRVEGIAWGQPFGPKGQEGTVSPHAGPHVVYEGGSVFVRGVDFTETKARGKPVRVTGTLRFEPKTGTRWGDVKGYYYIEATGFEAIDAVTDPYLVYLEK